MNNFNVPAQVQAQGQAQVQAQVQAPILPVPDRGANLWHHVSALTLLEAEERRAYWSEFRLGAGVGGEDEGGGDEEEEEEEEEQARFERTIVAMKAAIVRNAAERN
ncbi:hypothetical protein NHQ30_000723 [Ciborinia camelliae]|nr:hypothetical protein NHQ30_000723 [Ciborinia camelliae]